MRTAPFAPAEARREPGMVNGQGTESQGRKSKGDSPDENYRQAALLHHALKHPGQRYTIANHRRSHNVAYQTARTDLLDLAKRGLLEQAKVGKTLLLYPENDLNQRLLKLENPGEIDIDARSCWPTRLPSSDILATRSEGPPHGRGRGGGPGAARDAMIKTNLTHIGYGKQEDKPDNG